VEDHRDDPGDDEGEPHEPEDVAGGIRRPSRREADRQKPAIVTSVPDSIGAACGSTQRRRLEAIHALFHFHHHHLDGE